MRSKILDSLVTPTETLPAAESHCEKSKAKNKKATHHYKPKRRLYFSKRFPFLHFDRKRSYTMGFVVQSNFW